MTKKDQEEFITRLKNMSESDIRLALAQKRWNKHKIPLAQEHLHSLESSRSEETLVRQVDRELTANDLAKEANLIALAARDDAKEANSIARNANLTALEALRLAQQQRTVAILAAIIAGAAVVFTIWPPSTW